MDETQAPTDETPDSFTPAYQSLLLALAEWNMNLVHIVVQSEETGTSIEIRPATGPCTCGYPGCDEQAAIMMRRIELRFEDLGKARA